MLNRADIENREDSQLAPYARSDAKYVNLDSEDGITNVMASYVLSRPNVFWHTDNSDLKDVLVHLSNGYVDSVIDFLQKVFQSDK